MPSWSGFHRLPHKERLARVADHANLTADERAVLEAASALPQDIAEGLIENCTGTFPLPLGFAVGFVVDDAPVVVPMAVEESSVVAAASHGAKLAAAGGGFTTEVTAPVTIGQIEVRDVADADAAMETVESCAVDWMEAANGRIPRMVDRGGGVVGLVARPLAGGRFVVHIHVDCRDAMGANLVNDLCEFLGPAVADAVSGRLGLRILSNLATERLATARCRVPVSSLGADGAAVAAAIVEANDFALVDPYRAATHNKGILNGIDPVVVATGNDWRAVEAGAHAFAAMDGYAALTRWAMDGDDLVGELTLPLSLGTVGGVTALHPTARVCLKVLGQPDALRLAGVVASVGLAQNLSALKALATEGIQRGHMGLHARNLAMQAGLTGDAADAVVQEMVASGDVSADAARRLAAAYK